MSDVVLGIDIGGTNTVFGIIDSDGKVLCKESLPTRATKPAEDLFQRLFKKFKANKECTKHKLVGIGAGAPNANFYKSTIENPINLNWGFVNAKEIINKYYDLPFFITNDANAAALGEKEFGNAKKIENFIEITLGTGLGSGIVINGDLLYGHDGFAGEMGHVKVDNCHRECGCGRVGCLETVASATGLKRTMLNILASSTEDSKLRDKSMKGITALSVYEAAMNGDKLALRAFDYTAEILGKAMADATAYFSPEAFVLFGGLASSGDLLFNPLRKHFEANLMNIYKNKVKIELSGLPSGNAAILGAAALVWHDIKNK